jgi:hypothetical protein
MTEKVINNNKNQQNEKFDELMSTVNEFKESEDLIKEKDAKIIKL